MPWTKDDVDDHKKGLTDEQKEQWVAVANSALESCLKEGGDEESCAVSAIKQANAAVEEKKSMPVNKEIRIIPDNDSEVRVIGNSRKVEGYGIVFNKRSLDLGGFVEVIEPGAVEGVIERSDVLALLNHDVNKGLLARSIEGEGSLKLVADKKGVKYSFEAPNFDLGNELVEGIKRGDIKGSSFAFSLPSDKSWGKWDKTEDGKDLRIIKKFDQIYDMSPCYREAYPDTSVALRSLEEKNITITEKIEFSEQTNTLEKSEEIRSEDTEIKPVTEEPVKEPIVEVKSAKIEGADKRGITYLIINKMNIIEKLLDERAMRIEENDKIANECSVSKRYYTEAETETTNGNNQRIAEIDIQIETEKRKQGNGKNIFIGPLIKSSEKEEFSILKSLRHTLQKRDLPYATMEMNERGRDDFKLSGNTSQGDLVFPNLETPDTWRKAKEKRADILAGTATQGQEIVAEDKKAILPPLADKLVLAQAGATYLPGLVGTVSIPAYAGTTVAWKTEVEAAADGGGAFKEVNFSPKRLTGYVNVSKTFLAQDGVGAERLLLNNIAEAVARKLEATILGPATVAAGYPSGIGYKLNVANDGGVAVLTGDSITYAALVGLETTVDVLNALDNNLAYVTNGTARGILKTIDKGTSNDTGDYLIDKDGKINGYPLLATNAVVSTYGAAGDGNMVAFGNWADLCIAQWGGYDITVDPYTAAKTNQIVLVINVYFDAKGLRGSTGSTTTLDEYAYSFSALSIK